MGILDGSNGGGDLSIEADTVVSSVVLGFLKSECEKKHNIWIGYGEPKDKDNHMALRKKLVNALGLYNGAEYIKVVLTPGWRDYKSGGDTARRAITGAGGEGGQRDIEMSKEAMEFALDLQANTQGAMEFQDFSGGKNQELSFDSMDERGAYYGIVDYPNEVRLTSTTRRLIGYTGSEGRRWNSGAAAHGMIPAQMANFEKGTSPWGFGSMAALDTPFERKCSKGEYPGENEGVVGYCHGMNWSIMHCKLLGGGTPYEVAVGTGTTKLASCFGCTTFMYANGFPPSYVHLGRAESWVPVPVNGTDNPEFKGDNTAAITGLNDAWANTVSAFLVDGANLLKFKASDSHKTVATKLIGALGKRSSNMDKANMFLDALTVHDSDYKRLNRALF